jgi:Flp pilus assembly protein TadG
MIRSTYQQSRVFNGRVDERRGAIIVLTAFMMVVLLVFVALAVDIGYISVARTELQRTADSAAMASAWEMLGEERLQGSEQLGMVHQRARQKAAEYALLNKVCGSGAGVDINESNHTSGDILFGRYVNGGMSNAGSTASYNAVRVRVLRTNERNGRVPLFFARILGIDSQASQAEAIAMFRDGISGFRATEHTGNSSLLPFALDIKTWNNLMAGNGADNWSFDPATKEVSPSSDGVPEAKLFPTRQSKGSGITPGNFGTVDIGLSNNSSSVLRRQISEGVSQSDLAHHGGELKLDPVTKTLTLNGDTGISATIEAALPDALGKPRTIPLYSEVTGGGNTSKFTIVAFVGVRILDFRLNGGDKYISIQPAVVVDDTAISTNEPTSYNVFQPVMLVR